MRRAGSSKPQKVCSSVAGFDFMRGGNTTLRSRSADTTGICVCVHRAIANLLYIYTLENVPIDSVAHEERRYQVTVVLAAMPISDHAVCALNRQHL